MNAVVALFTVEIICPKCDTSIPEPRTGSMYWLWTNAKILTEIQCPDCGRTLKVKLPKDTK